MLFMDKYKELASLQVKFEETQQLLGQQGKISEVLFKQMSQRYRDQTKSNYLLIIYWTLKI